MDFVSPLVSRLSVVAAYVALAFVGAIVLGVFRLLSGSQPYRPVGFAPTRHFHMRAARRLT